jgi:hypothetical protein
VKDRRERLDQILDQLPEGKRIALKLMTGIAWDVADIEQWKHDQRAKYGTIVNRRAKSLPDVVLQEYKSIEAMNKQLDKIYDGPVWKRGTKDITDLAKAMKQLQQGGDPISTPSPDGESARTSRQ